MIIDQKKIPNKNLQINIKKIFLKASFYLFSLLRLLHFLIGYDESEMHCMAKNKWTAELSSYIFPVEGTDAYLL